MKKILVLVAAMLLVAGLAFGATVVGSKHDITLLDDGAITEVCVFCHTPHQSASANKQDPLWNRSLSSETSFGVYTSDTMNATPTAFGGGTLGSANTSQLCMSCHDGTLAVNALFNGPGSQTAGTATSATGNANLGSDLSDDHPVNFVYDAALVTSDGGLNNPTALTGVRLFATRVQCASCHNVHDNQYGPFLRTTNAGSAMCVKCHVK